MRLVIAVVAAIFLMSQASVASGLVMKGKTEWHDGRLLKFGPEVAASGGSSYYLMEERFLENYSISSVFLVSRGALVPLHGRVFKVRKFTATVPRLKVGTDEFEVGLQELGPVVPDASKELLVVPLHEEGSSTGAGFLDTKGKWHIELWFTRIRADSRGLLADIKVRVLDMHKHTIVSEELYKESPHDGLRRMDLISLPGVGDFRIVSILPSAANRPAWIALAKYGNDGN